MAGFITKNPKINSRAIVNDMLKTMNHRGPDQKGLYKEITRIVHAFRKRGRA